MSRRLNIVNAFILISASAFLSWGQTAPRSAKATSNTAVRPTPAAAGDDRLPEEQKDQVANVPYFTLREGLNSTLTLNNNPATPTSVTITIFNSEGRSKTLDPTTIPPHSFKQIELRDVVDRESFDQGSISVAYYGKEMDVTTQVSVYSLEKRIAFESREQGMFDFESNVSNGILFLPQKGAHGFLGLTNVAKNNVTVQVSVGSKSTAITLGPRETHVVKLDGEFDLHPPTSALVKLSQNGLPGNILTTGFVVNEENGYSSAFTMFDSKVMRSSHLAGAHFRFGTADPKEGFPPGTTFTAPLLLANVSDAPVTAHVAVDYTLAEKPAITPINSGHADDQDYFGTVAVKNVTIAPGSIERIELGAELARLGVQTPVKESGVDIDYQAPPGSLIGHLVSADRDGKHVFEVPIKDAFAWNAMIEGIYPWTLENGTRTVLHLKNRTGNSLRVQSTISFPGGTYNLPKLSLEPYQTIAVDIQDLKDSKRPDARGMRFPAEAMHGQIVWFPEVPYSIVARAEQVNTAEGIAHSFSCQVNCCMNYQEWGCTSTSGCAPGIGGPSVSGLTGEVGGNGTLNAYSYGYDCNRNPFGPNTAGIGTTWSSNDTSIATVSGSGSSVTVNYQATGSTNISANIPIYSYDYSSCCICHGSGTTYTTVSYEQAPVQVTCGDANKDALIQEYRTYPTDPNSPFIPTCNIFSQFTQSFFFQASELRTGDDYSWALIRLPLTVDHTLGYGMDLWRANYGSSRIVNSGYRNPKHNADPSVGGVANSQHVFGTAADLRNQSGGTTEYNNMVTAAQNANADFIEPTSGPCGMACVHADWRSHDVGQYALDQ